VPFVPIASALVSFALMLSLPVATWARLAVWMAVGVGLYFAYGRLRSKVGARSAS
jgi:APA family basic amino acid/polyamine antiporter